MTGTAKTEEKEFVEIYNLHVVEIPTNVEVARADQNDFIFKTKEAKYDAVLADIKERHEIGQPVLVGTISVEVSEHLSQLLQRVGIPHNVLNAKAHEREAEIIKDAGQPGAVTIATNMAGRGVDIKLAEGMTELGGLYVLGTERHEARRIDNQLRGRSGRQGDPGESRFYLSGNDDLVRLFAGDRIHSIMERFKVPDDQPMESGLLSKQIENAQKKVEEQNFVARKNVLKYDDVMNTQREVIYAQRRQVLEGADLSDEIKSWIDDVIERLVELHTEGEYAEEWDLDGLVQAFNTLTDADVTVDELREDLQDMSREALVQDFLEEARELYEEKEESWGEEIAREIERYIVLEVVDTRWREHLENMDYLREGVHLRAFAQKDPLVEYRSEGHCDVRGARPADPGGGPDAPLPCADRAARGRGARRARTRLTAAGLRTSTSRSPARTRSPLQVTGWRRQHRARRRRGGCDAAAGHGRSRQDRPQRSLLVRLRQEVQEVPRRVAVVHFQPAEPRQAPRSIGGARHRNRGPAGAGRPGPGRLQGRGTDQPWSGLPLRPQETLAMSKQDQSGARHRPWPERPWPFGRNAVTERVRRNGHVNTAHVRCQAPDMSQGSALYHPPDGRRRLTRRAPGADRGPARLGP